MLNRISDAVWKDSEESASAWTRPFVHAARVLWLATEGFLADACSMRASALTLASVFALVPALAVSFAYVRGLGWRGARLESLLLQRATVLSADAVSTVVSWVDHISIAGLGLMGALFAVGSAVSLLLQIEDGFDAVWGNTQSRGMARRLVDGMMLLVIAPMLVAVAVSLEAGVRSSAALHWLQSFGGLEIVVRGAFSLLWNGIVCTAFAALYYFLPSAPVDRRTALLGGLVAGITWQFAQQLYIDFQIGMTGYNAVYGALAQLPVLVLWIWTSWVVVLAGAEIAAASQNLATCLGRYSTALVGAAARERLALAIAIELADAAYAKRPAPTLTELAAILGQPVRIVAEMFGVLERDGMVHSGGERQLQCFLSLSPGSIALDRVLHAARGEGEAVVRSERPAIARVLAQFAVSRREALGDSTLADLVA